MLNFPLQSWESSPQEIQELQAAGGDLRWPRDKVAISAYVSRVVILCLESRVLKIRGSCFLNTCVSAAKAVTPPQKRGDACASACRGARLAETLERLQKRNRCGVAKRRQRRQSIPLFSTWLMLSGACTDGCVCTAECHSGTQPWFDIAAVSIHLLPSNGEPFAIPELETAARDSISQGPRQNLPARARSAQ